MRCGVESVSFSAKGAAIAADHEVLFDEQDRQSRAREKIGTDKSTDAGANNDAIVRIPGCVAKAAETPGHECAAPGGTQMAPTTQPERTSVPRWNHNYTT